MNVLELGCLILNLAMATVVSISVQVAIPSKGIKYFKWQLLIAFVEYVFIIWGYQSFPIGSLPNTIVYVISAILEVGTVYILAWLGSKGNYWRNIFVAAISVTVSNMVCNIVIGNIKLLGDPYYDFLLNYTPIKASIALCILPIYIAVTFVIAKLLSKIFKFNYNKKGKAYMYIMIAYTVVILGVSFYRRYALINIDDKDSSGFRILYIVFVISLLLVCVVGLNSISVVYNRVESKRIKEEREVLKNSIKINTAQNLMIETNNEALKKYNMESLKNADSENARSSNKKKYLSELTETIKSAGIFANDTLTGNVYIDYVLSDYIKKLETKGIVFEYHVNNKNLTEPMLAPVIDGLIGVAENYVQDTEEKYIVLSIRESAGPLIIKLEFSKNEDKKINNREINKLLRNSKDNYALYAMELYYIQLKSEDMRNKASISVMIEQEN